MAVSASPGQEEKQEEIAAVDFDKERFVAQLVSVVVEFVVVEQERPTFEEIFVVSAGVDFLELLSDYFDARLSDFQVCAE